MSSTIAQQYEAAYKTAKRHGGAVTTWIETGYQTGLFISGVYGNTPRTPQEIGGITSTGHVLTFLAEDGSPLQVSGI